MPRTITCPQALVHICKESDGTLQIDVERTDPGLYVEVPSWRTRYPEPLVEKILAVKGAAYLCDELKRDEDPGHVEAWLRSDLLSYVSPKDMVDARILDFGCGAGASTAVLARMFPGAHITGVELIPELAGLAQARVDHYALNNVDIRVSPAPVALPAGIGQFDHILLSAVWEHLLPAERPAILKVLWDTLRAGGVLFVDQTPYRWSPVEAHTTGLPLLNYLPDHLALVVARRLSPRVAPDTSWETLLRQGVRGGSEGEIMRLLRALDEEASLLQPTLVGRDRIDVWQRTSAATGRAAVKRVVWVGLKALNRLTGLVILPRLAVAIRKAPAG